MDTLTGVIIVIVAAIVVGFIAGNGAVYMFNRLPDTWLCDYGEEPSKEVSVEGGQRIKSWPWKWVFSASFIVVGIYMGVSDWQYAVAGLCACWLLLLLAWADGKYKTLLLIKTSPLFSFKSPDIILAKVVFPAPFSPINPKTSPPKTFKLILFRISF